MTNNDEKKPQSDSWCETDFRARKTSEGTFIWKISGFVDHREEFRNCPDMDNILDSAKSREFSVRAPDGKETKWMLECIPKYSTNYVGVLVVSRNKLDVKAKINLSIINNNEERVNTNNNCPNFNPHKFSGTSKEIVFSIYYSDLDTTLMPNGDLTFVCAITIYGSPKSTFGSKKLSNLSTAPTDPSLKVCENLDEFFLSKELSDVLIECKDKMFEAHQVILSSRSPVFRGMFQADMKEKKSQHVEVKDLEPDVVAEMLKFIYTGSCVATEENPDLDMVSDLLVASDMYQIETLKNVCQTLLSSRLEVENSLKFLVLGDMYGAEKLKEPAMDIVVNNMNGLIVTEEWRECTKKSPHIVVEVAEAMAKSAS